MPEHWLSLTRISPYKDRFPYKDRIKNSVLIRKSTSRRKSVFQQVHAVEPNAKSSYHLKLLKRRKYYLVPAIANMKLQKVSRF